MINNYISSQEAAELLGISMPTLYRYTSLKLIPFFKPDGSSKLYFRPSDLTDFIEQGRVSSQQEIEQIAAERLTGGKNV